MNSMTFDETYLGPDGSGNFGLTVTKSKWPFNSSPRVDIQTVAYGAGVSQKAFWHPRRFAINCVIEGASMEDLGEKIDNLSMLFSTQQEKAISFDSFKPNIFWYARYTGGLEDVEIVGTKSAMATLQFECPDSLGYSIDEYTTSIDITGSPQSFYVDTSSSVPGTWYTNPTIVVDANGTPTAISIVNTTIDEGLLYSASLNSGDMLRIDCERFIVEKSTNNGTTWNANMQSVSGTFPRLQPNVQNAFTVTGLDSATITFTYRGRYI